MRFACTEETAGSNPVASTAPELDAKSGKVQKGHQQHKGYHLCIMRRYTVGAAGLAVNQLSLTREVRLLHGAPRFVPPST